MPQVKAIGSKAHTGAKKLKANSEKLIAKKQLGAEVKNGIGSHGG
jgi:hypothetical protein